MAMTSVSYVFRTLLVIASLCYSGMGGGQTEYPGRGQFFEKDLENYRIPAAKMTEAFERYQQKKNAPVSVTSPGAVVTVYHFLQNTDHFYTRSRSEGLGAGYALQGELSFLSEPQLGTHPLYRCFNLAGADHFMSRDSGCEGFTNEGILGYLLSQAYPDATVALYGCIADTGHLAATDKARCDSGGFGPAVVLGYLPPSQ